MVTYMTSKEDWRQQILDSHKGLAKKVENNSTSAAVRLFCLECVGNRSADVKNCSDKGCFLWPYRFGCRPKKSEKTPTKLEDIFPELIE